MKGPELALTHISNPTQANISTQRLQASFQLSIAKQVSKKLRTKQQLKEL